jgi:WD40 repeat protein
MNSARENDQYMLRHLVAHLVSAAAGEDRPRHLHMLTQVLSDLRFMDAKIGALGVDSLLNDLSLAIERCGLAGLEPLRRVIEDEAPNLRGASRLGAPALVPQQIRNRAQFGSTAAVAAAAQQRLTELGEAYLALDWRTGRGLLRSLHLSAPGGVVEPVAMTDDSRFGVTQSRDGVLTLWDLDSGTSLRGLGRKGPLRSLAIASAARLVVCDCPAEGRMLLWKLDTGEHVDHLTAAGAIQAIAVTADGSGAVTATADGLLQVWDLRHGRELRRMRHEGELPVLHLGTSRDGGRISSASPNGELRCWDSGTGRQVAGLTMTAGWEAVAVTPDGRRAVVAVTERRPPRLWHLHVWDVEARKLVQLISTEGGSRVRLAITPDGRRAICGFSGGAVTIWDLDDGACAAAYEAQPGVYEVAMTHGGRRALSASSDGSACQVQVWDADGGRRVGGGHQKMVWALAAGPAGRHVASASEDHTVKLWESATGAEVRTLTGHLLGVRAVAMTPDGRHVVSVCSAGEVRRWDLWQSGETGSPSLRQEAYTSAIAPDGSLLCLASGGVTRVLDLPGGAERGRLHQEGRVHRIAVTCDATRAVVASRNEADLGQGWSVATWDLTRCAELCRLPVPGVGRWWITALAASGDGRRAVAGLSDGRILIWEVESGAATGAVQMHHDSVFAIAALPGERFAVSSGEDRSLVVWDLATGQPVATAYVDAVATAIAAVPGRVLFGDGNGDLQCMELVEG